MKTLSFLVLPILALLLFTTSCTKKESIDVAPGSVTIQLQKTEPGLKSTQEDIVAVYMSIKDANSEYVYNVERFELINIGGGYLTQNIELPEGDYTVEDFIVVDSNDSAIYLTPKEGSEFACYVDDPLPMSFVVSSGNTTNVNLQVISVDLGKAEQFGYAVFSFDIVDESTMIYEIYDTSFVLNAFELSEDSTGYWEVVENTGIFSLSDNHNPYCVFTGELLGEYRLRWTATCCSESQFEEVIIKIVGFTDSRDGNKYKACRIGDQIWMAENLRAIAYDDGELIPLVIEGTQWINKSTPAYCWYNNDSITYAETYGALYNWHTVNTGKLSPNGWHVPSDVEWNQMVEYLGRDNVAGSKLKEKGNSHWLDTDPYATNEFGFTALPGGYRATDGNFYHLGLKGHWWSSTSYSYTHAIKKDINGENGILNSGIGNKSMGGVSIRCIKN